MKTALWFTNKFTNHSSVYIQHDTDEEVDKIDLFGDTIEQHITSLAHVISAYKLTTIKTDKDYLPFEIPLNSILAQNYDYHNKVTLEEM